MAWKHHQIANHGEFLYPLQNLLKFLFHSTSYGSMTGTSQIPTPGVMKPTLVLLQLALLKGLFLLEKMFYATKRKPTTRRFQIWPSIY